MKNEAMFSQIEDGEGVQREEYVEKSRGRNMLGLWETAMSPVGDVERARSKEKGRRWVHKR